MTDNPKRVALLARPGAASERLRGVLADAGVEGVLDADPTTLDSGTLAASGAEVVLVALDAATEESLARFESVLGDPAINVIYEEADLIAAREGWDAARWQRHLVAKLQGHGDVLPPGRDGGDTVSAAASNGNGAAASAVAPSSAAPSVAAPSVAAVSALSAPSNDAATAVQATGANAAAVPVPAAVVAAPVAPEPSPAAEVPQSQASDFDPIAAEFSAQDEAAVTIVAAPLEPVSPYADAASDSDLVLASTDGGFDPVAAELSEHFGDDALSGATAIEPPLLDSYIDAGEGGVPADAGYVVAPMEFDDGDGSGSPASESTVAVIAPPALDDSAAAGDVAASAEEPSYPGFSIEFSTTYPRPDPEGTEEPVVDYDTLFGGSADEAAVVEKPAYVPPTGGSRFGELSLDDGSNAVALSDTPKAADRFRDDLAQLDERISTLTLVDDTPKRGPEQPRGAVLVLAGIGGPDAVRQLLGSLPNDFPRPVLVQQRLDGGRYDKLVAQMQRATTLPVRLAEPGLAAIAGLIYIVPAELGITVTVEGIRFNEDGGDILAALPAADSAVLLLSGSDATLVDTVMNFGWAGAMVAGQSPEGCFDAAAPAALVARGGKSGQPAELAQRLAERW
ncbi:chemotaxis protein CheB [Montanilutibacter psychrotolerans]|uniref:CheB-type methylesterase domain-containing protein n=1 Tax=Montanilutibacter psychrotolerans TaxID=1327343 RepID=A0A3M8SXL6_9GAMM|nr:chemotaxis protein CheB [Lysobacter psychrotolerans]RNF84196.1 hypothetical protein EER27_07295 [Lysobacter psychrotolerans]